ncbi:3467_t:CDS:2, partial [Dentiscutata erythropus]
MVKKSEKEVSTKEQNLYQKLQLIQSEIKELIRTEENKFQKYKFFNELQVLKLLRPLLEKYKLTLLLSDDTSQPLIHEKEGKEHFIKYLKKLEIVDAENPDQRLLFNFWAVGSNVDLAKAKGSSETYATKYLLSKFFLMPVKDEADPDYGREEEKEEPKKENSPASSVPNMEQSLTELAKQTQTISVKQVDDLVNLLRQKVKINKEIQTQFLTELDQQLAKRGVEGTTNAGNFRKKNNMGFKKAISTRTKYKKSFISMPRKKLSPIHPGEILRERLLVPRDISPQELAAALKVPKEQIKWVCEERADITPDLAARLALYFDSTRKLFLIEQGEEVLNMPLPTIRKKFKKNVREYMEANARDKRDFNMFAAEKGAVTSLRLELIQGTKNHYSIRTGGPWRIFFEQWLYGSDSWKSLALVEKEKLKAEEAGEILRVIEESGMGKRKKEERVVRKKSARIKDIKGSLKKYGLKVEPIKEEDLKKWDKMEKGKKKTKENKLPVIEEKDLDQENQEPKEEELK